MLIAPAASQQRRRPSGLSSWRLRLTLAPALTCSVVVPCTMLLFFFSSIIDKLPSNESATISRARTKGAACVWDCLSGCSGSSAFLFLLLHFSRPAL
ncbi:hypothetical protein BCV69DRAFT_23779 [Microstroma glucosiphilum]|uniref:Uncharacterized protein n=1 Tax=Pseudomicrostroma glucosiphilum TaxID=1684307 RepID=A0A316UIR9_9BASI|nr:hypothetical protein BCV69DRAFT_23779 [Pseudomicrostroma glucosiphilum]PWN24231.1 hypothetical protein BCV69DRAFT_23779 [Pseudomicrostroma glucosiphilum]